MAFRRVIRIQVMNRPWRALRAVELAPKETPIPAARAWSLVEREFLRPTQLSNLSTLWQAIATSGINAPSTTIRLAVIKEAFLSGHWVLLPPAAEAAAIAATPPVESLAEQLRVAKVVKTWIEIEVVDELGRPISGEPYDCMMPDGKIETGTLDSRGRVRFDGIDSGTCVFSLTGQDKDTWKKAS